MKFLTTRQWHPEIEITSLFVKGIKIVLSLLIATILLALFGGVVKTAIDLSLLFSSSLDMALRKIILDGSGGDIQNSPCIFYRGTNKGDIYY